MNAGSHILTVLVAGFSLVVFLDYTHGRFNTRSFSRESSLDMSINAAIDTLSAISSYSVCAARCAQHSNCTAFMYSRSQKVCHLGFGVVNARDKSYLTDSVLYKWKMDYFEEFSCSSIDFNYTVCPLPGAVYVSAVLVEQESKSPCNETTFGLTPDNNLWVTKGCRGRFGVGH